MDRLEGLALDLRLRRTLGVCRRRGGEGVVRGVVARRVVGRRRSVPGRIRTLKRVFSGYLAYFFEVGLRGDTKGPKRGKEGEGLSPVDIGDPR